MAGNRARYRIGKISELIGISSEALRYYEREGLVAPEKSADSGYRSYSAWDVHVLIRTRMYRKYGLTLDETMQAFDSPEFND
ncbi:MAG: MerR family transcriptional regulator, partial [Eggerthellaceae bacterium]|nr:MerR family transcriptional regulator [Eggerthellaceae bacterium]